MNDQRADNRFSGTHGVAVLEELVRRPVAQGGLGAIFRRIPQEDDVGIDGHIELRERSHFSTLGPGKLLGVQVKSHAELKGDKPIRVTVERSKFDYWISHSVPVILVVVGRNERSVFWVRADLEGFEETPSGVCISVPRNQLLDASSLPALEYIARNSTASAVRFARLEAQHSWMRRIAAGETIQIRIYEWTGRDFVRLEVGMGGVTEHGGMRWETESYSGSDDGFLEMLEGEFPWAAVKLNEEAYAREMRSFFNTYNRNPTDEDFAEWSGEFEEDHGHWSGDQWIYPCSLDDNGALYIFEVALNELGRAFLTVYDHLHPVNRHR